MRRGHRSIRPTLAAWLLASLAACHQVQNIGDSTRICEADPCADITVSHARCGSCEMQCPNELVCGAGRCMASCPAGTEDCDDFGSCSRLDTDDNCGACGNRCPPGNICDDKRCKPGSHQIHQVCWTNPGGGLVLVCADLSNDFLHCGSCNNVCPSGHPCVDGVCR